MCRKQKREPSTCGGALQDARLFVPTDACMRTPTDTQTDATNAMLAGRAPLCWPLWVDRWLVVA
jgi:hypothetical protein